LPPRPKTRGGATKMTFLLELNKFLTPPPKFGAFDKRSAPPGPKRPFLGLLGIWPFWGIFAILGPFRGPGPGSGSGAGVRVRGPGLAVWLAYSSEELPSSERSYSDPDEGNVPFPSEGLLDPIRRERGAFSPYYARRGCSTTVATVVGYAIGQISITASC